MIKQSCAVLLFFWAGTCCLAETVIGPKDGSSALQIKGKYDPLAMPGKIKYKDGALAEKCFYVREYDKAAQIFEPMVAAKDRHYALFANQLGSVYLTQGKTDQALDTFLNAYYFMNDIQATDTKMEKRAISLSGKESDKAYKGDPYERVMNALYVALLLYGQGDTENAMAAVRTGILADSDVNAQMYKSDVTLLYVLGSRLANINGDADLAKQYQELAGNAYCDTRSFMRPVISDLNVVVMQIEVLQAQKSEIVTKYEKRKSLPRKAQKQVEEIDSKIAAKMAEQKSLEFKRKTLVRDIDLDDVEAMVDPQYNVLLCIELGRGPVKYNTGEFGEMAKFSGSTPMIGEVNLRISGTTSEDIFRVECDPHYQASTRGGRMMDGILRGQALYKATMRDQGEQLSDSSQKMMYQANASGSTEMMAVASIFALAGAMSHAASAKANPTADIRHWSLMPAEVVMVPCKVPAGDAEFSVNVKDQNGRIMGQALEFTNTVKDNGDTIILKRIMP
jgi:tetratricopeptide (TPR) repeat protein